MSKTTTKITPKSSVSITSQSRITTGQWQSQLQKTQTTDDESSEEASVDEDDIENADNDEDLEEDEREKDKVEEELERLVFGDRAGFRAGLKDFGQSEDQNETSQQNDKGLENITDAELFFTDINPDEGLSLVPTSTLKESDHDATLRSAYPAVWEDSDDERMQVSLATAPRLRKLRHTEAEDIVNGIEYSKRLRQQFELLHPTPRWAIDVLQNPTRKKRRFSDNDSGSDAERSVDDMDVDAEHSVAPLSQLLQDAESLVRTARSGNGKKRKLRPEVLGIQRIKDIPGVQPTSITSLSFHPNLPLLLSSGPSSTVYLHHIASSPPAPTPNPLLTSLHVSGTHLTTTAFHPTTPRIFLSARRRYFHVWNLTTGQVEKVSRVYGQQHVQQSMERFLLSPDGKYMALLGSTRKGGGVINLLDSTTLQWTSQIRIDSRHGIADFAWWRDGRGLCIAGKNGEVTEWDVTEQRVVSRWQDEGAVGTTVLALGGAHDLARSPFGSDRWVAVGSSSGIVNIYDRRAWLLPNSAPAQQQAHSLSGTHDEQQPIPANPKPLKTLDHLTTPTSFLAFAPDGQILCMASKWKRDALRLIHLPTCTVFKNWPTSSTPLGRISSVAFTAGAIMQDGNGQRDASAEGDVLSVLAVANEQGKIRLWEIR